MSEAALLPIVQAAAARHGIRPGLLEGLVAQESAWNPGAVSGSGAIGPTQLMPATARELGVDPYDAAQNVEGGAKYLKQQLDRFGGDERLALAAYNAGPGAVQKYGGIPPFAQTQNYVPSVLGKAARYGNGGPAPTTATATLPAAAPQARTEDPLGRLMRGLVGDALRPVSFEQPSTPSARQPSRSEAANNVRGFRLSDALLSSGFSSAPFEQSDLFGNRRSRSRMAGDALAGAVTRAPGGKSAVPFGGDQSGADPLNEALTKLTAGLFTPRDSSVPRQAASGTLATAQPDSSIGGQAGRVVEYLTGDKTHPRYDPSHGGGNYHEHLAFASKDQRDQAAAYLKSNGIQIGSMNDGRHAPGSYHYSDQAFDVPASQVPVGQEGALSARVRQLLRAGGFGGI